MNDLEKNRIQRLENQIQALKHSLIETNKTLQTVLVWLADEPSAEAIGKQIEALKSITPRLRD